MSRWLALVSSAEKEIYSSFDSMTKPDKSPPTQPQGAFCRVLSNCQVKIPEKGRAGLPVDCDHGFAIGNRPKTWTGEIVSLEEWRQLSQWEKHGPDGRQWNGRTRKWEVPK